MNEKNKERKARMKVRKKERKKGKQIEYMTNIGKKFTVKKKWGWSGGNKTKRTTKKREDNIEKKNFTKKIVKMKTENETF